VLGFQVKTSVPVVDQTVVLGDGRRLGHAVWGQPGGGPVLLVGAWPGWRLRCPDLPATLAAGVRLVTVDRPGAGRWDPDPHPGMARWVADAAARARTRQADHLLAIPLWGEILGSLGPPRGRRR
jgi:pimeloyl-ACP methyl ester carboxylesterase